MDEFVIISLFIIIFASFIAFYVQWRKRQMTVLERNGIKGPKPNLFFGNTLEMQKYGDVTTQGKWMKQYGPIVGFYVGRHPMVIVSDLELLKQIQISEFKHFNNRFYPLKNGLHPDPRNNHTLIRVKDQRWKEMRNIIKQAFTASKLNSSIGIMGDTVDGLIASIERLINEGKEEFDIHPLFQALSLETIGRSAFGITTEAQTNTNDPFLKFANSVFDISFRERVLLVLSLCFPEFESFLYPLRRLLELLIPSDAAYLMKESAVIVNARISNNRLRRNDLLQAMLEAKVNVTHFSSIDDYSLTTNAELSKGENNDTNNPNEKTQTYKNMSVDEVVANTMVFLEAGYESTSASLAFIMHNLVNHVDVQEKVRDEVMQLLEKDQKLDHNIFSSSPYIDAVIYETLRLYPPFTFSTTRVANVDYKSENFTIPKGATVVVPVYQLHHDPNLWEEPEKFDPCRFYGENKHTINNLAWQPFGAGPRNCIGMKFAICEIKLALAKLLSRYRFEVGPRTQVGDLAVRRKLFGMCPENVFVKAIRI